MIETLILGGAIYAGVSARFIDGGVIPDELNPLLPKALAFTVVMMGLMTASGLYDLEWQGGVRTLLQRLGLSFGLGLLTMSLLFYFFPALLVGRGAFLLSFGLALLGILLSRTLFIHWVRGGAFKSRALVIGTGSRAAQIESILANRGHASNTEVVGYVPMGGSHHFVNHVRILNTQETLAELVVRLQISEIILAVRDRREGGMPVQELLKCKLRGIRIMELSSFFERENGHLQIDSMNASWMILAEGFYQGIMRDTIKRLFDLVVSTALLVVSLPIMALTALFIKLESPGPMLGNVPPLGLSRRGDLLRICKRRSANSHERCTGSRSSTVDPSDSTSSRRFAARTSVVSPARQDGESATSLGIAPGTRSSKSIDSDWESHSCTVPRARGESSTVAPRTRRTKAKRERRTAPVRSSKSSAGPGQLGANTARTRPPARKV